VCGPLLKETQTTLRLAIRWNWEVGSSPNLVIARENVGAFKVLLPEVIGVLCRVPDELKHRASVFRAHPTSEPLNQFERLLRRGLGLERESVCRRSLLFGLLRGISWTVLNSVSQGLTGRMLIYLTKIFGAPFCFHR
jgi:hypothetical protein